MCVYLLCDQPCTTLPFMSSFSTRFLIDSYKFVTSQEGVPRGLQGPLAGCGARKPPRLPCPTFLPHPAAGGGARERRPEYLHKFFHVDSDRQAYLTCCLSWQAFTSIAYERKLSTPGEN